MRPRASSLLALLFLALASLPAHAAMDPLCDTNVASNLTLTRDIDCTGLTGNVLTITANGVTIDGAGHRIIAPTRP